MATDDGQSANDRQEAMPDHRQLAEQAADAVCASMAGWLHRRRSHLAATMVGPGPDDNAIRRLLALACRVPDHGKLAPWRFLVFAGAARAEAGALFARRARQLDASISSARHHQEVERFTRAPLVIGVISSPVESLKAPQWEQELSAGASCMALLTGALAMGFAAQWLTEWIAFDAQLGKAFGLSDTERFAGFIYIGTASRIPAERPRPVPDEKTVWWQAAPPGG